MKSFIRALNRWVVTDSCTDIAVIAAALYCAVSIGVVVLS